MHRNIVNGRLRLVAFGLGCQLILAVCSHPAAANIVAKLQSGTNLSVCAIGTSLTDANWNHPNGYTDWFDQTGTWLNSLPYTGKVTLHDRAVAASWSNSTYPNPDGGFLQLNTVLSVDNPDAIFIEFAVNDAYNLANLTVQNSKDNLQSMINQINTWGAGHSKAVDIVVLTMNNMNDTNGNNAGSARPNLAQYYQGYRDVAAANPGVTLIDNYPNWVNLFNSNMSLWYQYIPDGAHPNTAGATNVILPTVQAALVPEPATLSLLAAGGILLLRRRRA